MAQAQGERRKNQKNVGLFVTVGCPVGFTRQKLAATDAVSKGDYKRRLKKSRQWAWYERVWATRSKCTIDRFALEAAN